MGNHRIPSARFWCAAASLLFSVFAAGTAAAAPPTAGSDEAAQERLAKCIDATISDDVAFEIGEKMAIFEGASAVRWSAISCPGFFSLFVNRMGRVHVETRLRALLGERRAFRKGLYAGIGLPGLSRGQRDVLAVLGADLEDSAAAQAQAIVCQLTEPAAVAFVAQLDLPFAIAVVGARANVGNPSAAQDIAVRLVEKAQALGASRPPRCESATNKAFLAHAQRMHDFSVGKHAWAPGCSVTSDRDGLALKCAGIGNMPSNKG